MDFSNRGWRVKVQFPSSGGTTLLTLPSDPSGLPDDWQHDPSHRDPNGRRYCCPTCGMLDVHQGRPGLPGFRGIDHWHHNEGKEHLLPGTELP